MNVIFPNTFPELVTARLRLRQLRPTDAAAVYHVFADEEVVRYYDLERMTNLEQARELIERQNRRFERQEVIRWAITQQADDLVIGTCGLVISPQNAQGGLGYELARAYWRRGIMSEALRLVVHFGFHAVGLNRIQALVMPGNIPSAELLRTLGFTEEGLLRDYAFFKGRFQDLLVFSVLKREWPGRATY
jgi:ribosomal-protein-alanine N-acetyltransferase